jgi:hypothetical protein
VAPHVAVVLLAIAGALQLAGTATVAINYAKAARAGEAIVRALRKDDAYEREFGERDALRKMIHDQDPLLTPELLTATRQGINSLRRTIGGQLTARWYLTAGLVCLVLGTSLDTAAGIGSLVH